MTSDSAGLTVIPVFRRNVSSLTVDARAAGATLSMAMSRVDRRIPQALAVPRDRLGESFFAEIARRPAKHAPRLGAVEILVWDFTLRLIQKVRNGRRCSHAQHVIL